MPEAAGGGGAGGGGGGVVGGEGEEFETRTLTQNTHTQ